MSNAPNFKHIFKFQGKQTPVKLSVSIILLDYDSHHDTAIFYQVCLISSWVRPCHQLSIIHEEIMSQPCHS